MSKRPKSALEESFRLLLRSLSWEQTWYREFRVTPDRRWRFDFAFPEFKVAVEVEGGTWSGGRHTTGAGFEKDCEKYNTAAIMGWLVLRVTGKQIKSGEAIQWLREALEARHDY